MKNVIILSSMLMAMTVCSCHSDKKGTTASSQSEAPTDTTIIAKKITAEMAYEGVDNYCHKNYDWSIAKDNPSIMYVAMANETESEYNVTFRSYTGALVHFHVNKSSGKTRIVEYVPALDKDNEVGTINLLDYIEKK